MSQQAKDIYSGLKKKIIASSPSMSSSGGRRSGSFSLLGSFSISNASTSSEGGRASSSSLNAKGYADADLTAAAAAAAEEMYGEKKKERRPSFSFSSWKEKHRAKKQAKEEAAAAAIAAGTARPPQHERSGRFSTRSVSSSISENGSFRSQSESGSYYSQSESSYYTQSESSHRSHNESYRSSEGGYGYSNQRNHPTRVSSSNRSPRGSLGSRGGVHTPRHAPEKQTPPPPPPPPSAQRYPPQQQQQYQLQPRPRSNTGSSTSSTQSASSRTRTLSSVNPPGQPNSFLNTNSSSYSFSARRQEKTRTANQASTMIVDDVATIVKPRRARPIPRPQPTWDSSDTDEDADSFEDSQQPRTRGFSRRSVSMDFMEPQQPTHLISKIWRKLPIQARLYGGKGSIDLDLEKDRTSFSRSSATKHLRQQQKEYNIPTSPLPDESNIFGDKHIRFSHRLTYYPNSGPYVALESYDDVLVRVCQFGAHDQRRTAVKVQEFLERSMSYLRGTTSRRGLKISISNEEIKMWRRLARHNWAEEEITRIDGNPPKANNRRRSGSSVTEEETDEDDTPVVPSPDKLQRLVEVANFCLGGGDSLFTSDDVEELVTLELLVEEDGWI
ncbi:hypothetical protein Poli38472_013275 [Pythium oligandrum]|uniref:Uncharacterized protein n=1 Tax=Pythium oligandrum TaxID=41045 RepID=A0A8K1C2U0_PYTOL|nr:hypothetical protein Poli38472_013275 [Pythium oligandrum]|eukprot:TMW55384.1 hypothetical protein Poli38472_013275 [Pythium oligandrum]